MRQNVSAWLAAILVLTILAGFVDSVNEIRIGDLKIDTHIREGLDLQGGIQLVFQAVPRGNQPVTADQLDSARNIMEQRANQFTTEPIVQTAGNNRILAELPGVSDLEQAVNVMQQTAFLEFINSESEQLADGTIVCTTLNGVVSCPTAAQLNAATASPTSVTAPTATAVSGTPGTPSTVPSATATVAAQTTPVATPTPKTYPVVVTGDQIDGNKVAVAYDQAGLPRVTFTLKNDGPRVMADFTSSHVGKYMPIVLDKKVISSPQIQGAIVGGSGEINNINLKDAQKLAIQLKYGALPVGLELLESRKISATLGQDAINRSLIAGIIGLGLVVLFMLVYYRLPGALADVALIIYATVTLAVFKTGLFILPPVTLTLAGIAGFILSIGMAVDANVLIFARLKEELRSGKTLPAAVEAGFDHAWPSIRDSNFSTLITCAILFWFGSQFGGASIIKGFALTLAIGVAVSMFTALTVTRTFLRTIIRTRIGQSLWAFDAEEHHADTTAPLAEA